MGSTARWTLKDADPIEVALSPDARFGALVNSAGRLRCFDAKAGQWLTEPDRDAMGARAISWARTGARVAIGYEDGRLDLLELDMSGPPRLNATTLLEAAGEVSSLAFSGDGRTLVTGTALGIVSVLTLE